MKPLKHTLLPFFTLLTLQAGAEEQQVKPFVIGVQSTLPHETILLKQQFVEAQNKGWGILTETQDPIGTPIHVFTFSLESPYAEVVIVHQLVYDGMENAAARSVLLAQGSGTNLIPSVVLHEGLCSPVSLDKPNTIYLLNWYALGYAGILRDDGFTPMPVKSWNPTSKKLENRIYFPADQRLIRIAQEAFVSFKSSSAYLAFVEGNGGQNLELNSAGFGISSNSLVLGNRVRNRWKDQYETNLAAYLKKNLDQGKSYPLSTIDRETAACAKVFFEFNIPFAAARIPVRATRDQEVDFKYAKNLSDISQHFLWKWIVQVAENKNSLQPAQTSEQVITNQ